MDRLDRLVRDDLWALGAADGTAFRPEDPRWLDVPGWWDGLHAAGGAVTPGFAITLLGEDGRPLPTSVLSRRWSPAELVVQYRVGAGVTASELRTVHPGGRFVSEWRFAALRPVLVHLVAWTVRPAGAVRVAAVSGEGVVRAPGARGAPDFELAVQGGASSWDRLLVETAPTSPIWDDGPLVERWHGAGFAPPAPVVDDEGWCVVATHRAVQIDPVRGGSVAVALRVSPPDVPPPDPPTRSTFGRAARRAWDTLLATGPSVECSDPYVELAVLHRRWQLAACAAPPDGRIGVPHCRAAVLGEALPDAHTTVELVREWRWVDPARAVGLLTAFAARADADGRLPATLTDGAPPGLADWAEAFGALEGWTDEGTLAPLVVALERHADRLWATRMRHGLCSASTAAEVGDGRGPRWAAGAVLAVDASVHAWRLARLLARRSPDLAARTEWATRADQLAEALRTRAWDPRVGLFTDVDPATGRPTGVPSAAGLLVLDTDAPTAAQRAALREALVDPARFGTPFPLPTLAADAPTFRPDAVVAGRRVADAANGRGRLSLAIRVARACLRADAMPGAPGPVGALAATIARRTLRVLFPYGDLTCPVSPPDHHPLTGQGAPVQRLEGAVLDVVLTVLAGLRREGGMMTAEPPEVGLERLRVDGIPDLPAGIRWPSSPSSGAGSSSAPAPWPSAP